MSSPSLDRRVGFTWFAATVLAAQMLAPAPARAQHPFTPGVAFGAFVFPYVDGDRDTWAVQFDLFTELSKDLQPFQPPFLEAPFQRYNDIDRTLGFNQIGHTWVRALRFSQMWAVHTTGWLSGGVVWDTPTQYLQNDAAHGLRRLTFVPRDSVYDHAVVGAGGEVMASWNKRLAPWLDVVATAGGGGGLSTSYLDGYGQGGAEFGIRPGSVLLLRLGGLGRVGAVGDIFPDWDGLYLGLGNDYWLAQAWGLLPIDSFATWFPRIRIVRTVSRGPFTRAGGASKKFAKFWTFRFETVTGKWTVEMWNDLGYMDIGPTFGLRVQWGR